MKLEGTFLCSSPTPSSPTRALRRHAWLGGETDTAFTQGQIIHKKSPRKDRENFLLWQSSLSYPEANSSNDLNYTLSKGNMHGSACNLTRLLILYIIYIMQYLQGKGNGVIVVSRQKVSQNSFHSRLLLHLAVCRSQWVSIKHIWNRHMSGLHHNIKV